MTIDALMYYGTETGFDLWKTTQFEILVDRQLIEDYEKINFRLCAMRLNEAHYNDEIVPESEMSRPKQERYTKR